MSTSSLAVVSGRLRRRTPSAATLAIALVMSFALCVDHCEASTFAQDAVASNVSSLRTLESTVLREDMVRSSPTDANYFDGGRWIRPGDSCWTCDVAPGVAAAYLSRTDASWAPPAIATFNRALDDHQAADGSYTGGAIPSIETGFFAVQLGAAYLALGDKLAPATRRAWADAIVRAATYLDTSGNMSWWSNGNINLRYAEVQWLAWRVGGGDRFAAAFERAWNFVLAPPSDRWPGRGLRVTKQPARADGADGAAYLTEEAAGGPGFDPHYTQVQLEDAAQFYALSGDPRLVRLMNLLTNQLLPRVDITRMELDTTGGSRKSGSVVFAAPAIAMLIRSGSRPDLAPMLGAMFSRLEREYSYPGARSIGNFYAGTSRWLGTPLVDLGVTATPGESGYSASATRATTPGRSTAPSPTVTLLVIGRDVRTHAADTHPVAAAAIRQRGLWLRLRVGASVGTVRVTVINVGARGRRRLLDRVTRKVRHGSITVRLTASARERIVSGKVVVHVQRRVRGTWRSLGVPTLRIV